MENMVFMSSNLSGKSNYEILMRLALAEAREETSENADRDVIVIGSGSVGSGLITDAYVEITDLPVESDTSRQSFKNIHGKKSRW